MLLRAAVPIIAASAPAGYCFVFVTDDEAVPTHDELVATYRKTVATSRQGLRRSSTSTPSATNVSISSAEKPASANTSRPSAPNSGGPERTVPGVRLILRGMPVPV